MKKKIRYCPECGFRELDKWQKKCAECVQNQRDITLIKAWHTYSNSAKGKETIKNYQREYHRKRYQEDEEYRKLHIKRAVESNRKRRERKKQMKLF